MPVRIVSLLPSATEILFAIGAGDAVVGVTVECDHPPQARGRTVVSTTTLPPGLDPAEVDAAVSDTLAGGGDLYRLERGALAGLDADLVVTQDLCAVCALDAGDVREALEHLGCDGRVLTLAPTDLDSVLASILDLGGATGRGPDAGALVAALRDRLGALAERVAGARPVPVLVLEWTDPPYAPGHWIPEMVTAAGGVPALGAVGGRSERVRWEDVAACGAEVVVGAPCGLGLGDAAAATQDLLDRGLLPVGVPVWAVDANASWARPGPRLVDGAEDRAGVLHPDRVAPPHPRRARRLR